MDKQIADLYFTNHSNMEFVMEPEVKDYLSNVHNFLNTHFHRDVSCLWTYREEYDTYGLLMDWQKYIVEAIYEIYNSFICGNFMSAVAMSRSLMESCVYYTILREEKSSDLIIQWFFCNTMNSVRRMESQYQDAMKMAMELLCEGKNFDCDKMWNRYMDTKLYEMEWLKDLTFPEKPTFKNCCKYAGEENIYDDFRKASDFLHAQSTWNKMEPFTFYENIYSQLHIIMIYIFRALRLFNRNEEAEAEMAYLEIQIAELNGFWKKEYEEDLRSITSIGKRMADCVESC